ncbi:hypothetical protein AHAS_Ahas16G0239700 [Arachis hypogaea]
MFASESCFYDSETCFCLVIDLGNAQLWGHLVPKFGQLQNLQRLEFFNNDLTGPIPNELGNSINLEKLDLYSNNLTGVIPDTLGKWSQ